MNNYWGVKKIKWSILKQLECLKCIEINGFIIYAHYNHLSIQNECFVYTHLLYCLELCDRIEILQIVE